MPRNPSKLAIDLTAKAVRWQQTAMTRSCACLRGAIAIGTCRISQERPVASGNEVFYDVVGARSTQTIADTVSRETGEVVAQTGSGGPM